MVTPIVFLIVVGIAVVSLTLWHVHKHSDDNKETRDSDYKKPFIHP